MLITLLTIAQAAPPEVRLVTGLYTPNETDNTAHLALSPDSDTVNQLLQQVRGTPGEEVGSDGGTYHHFSIDRRKLDGLAVGDRWRLLSDTQEIACRVAGFELVVSPYQELLTSTYVSSGPCGVPLLTARLDCEGNPGGALIGIPQGAPTPTWGTATEAPLRPDLTARILRDRTVVEMQADITTRALARDETVQTSLEHTTMKMGTHTIERISGAFFTGSGDDRCGGEDLAARFSVTVIDGRPEPASPSEWHSILGILDLQGDGTPEILEWDESTMQIRDLAGNVLVQHSPDWCVCGC